MRKKFVFISVMLILWLVPETVFGQRTGHSIAVPKHNLGIELNCVGSNEQTFRITPESSVFTGSYVRYTTLFEVLVVSPDKAEWVKKEPSRPPEKDLILALKELGPATILLEPYQLTMRYELVPGKPAVLPEATIGVLQKFAPGDKIVVQKSPTCVVAGTVPATVKTE